MAKKKQQREQEPIYLTRLDIRNYKKIRAVSLELDRGVTRVTSGGENGQGKTSLVEAICDLLLGAGATPENPINDETTAKQKKAEVEGWISNGWSIELVHTDKGRYLRVKDPEGKVSGNQTTLNGWVGKAALQLESLWKLSDAERTERLLSLSPQDDLMDRLAANAEAYDALYAERTPHISEQQRLRKVRQPDGERPEPVDTSADMAKLKELRGQAGAREEVRAEHNESKALLQDVQARGKDLDDEIAYLERRLEEKRAARALVDDRLEKGKAHLKTLREKFEAMPDPSEEIEAIEARLERVSEAQEALEPWKEWDRAQEGLKAATAEAERLTEEIKANQAKRQEILAGADLPVDGLSVDADGSLLLNGRPLSAASGAEKTLLEIQAAIAENPQLRLVVCDEADGVGKAKRAEIAEIARRYDLDVILVQIGSDTDRGELEIVDGMGSNVEAEEEPEASADPEPEPEPDPGEDLEPFDDADLDGGEEEEEPAEVAASEDDERAFLLDEEDDAPELPF